MKRFDWGIISGRAFAGHAHAHSFFFDRFLVRVTLGSRKEAYERAKREGGGAEPRNDPHDGSKPHYHPVVGGFQIPRPLLLSKETKVDLCFYKKEEVMFFSSKVNKEDNPCRKIMLIKRQQMETWRA